MRLREIIDVVQRSNNFPIIKKKKSFNIHMRKKTWVRREIAWNNSLPHSIQKCTLAICVAEKLKEKMK